MTRWRIVLAFGLAFIPAGVGAQSHFNTAGLGLVQEALDARTRALGGIGVGLMGSGLLPSDPASIGRLGIPTAVFTAQPSWTDYRRSDGADAGTVQGTRFPLVGVAYPVRQWGIGYLTFGSVFDQRFQAERPGSVVLGLDTVNVVDSLHADGGVSQIRVGFARPFGKYLSAGVSVARYNGSALRRFTRTFADGEVDPSVQDFATGGLWRYSGTSVTMGAGAQMGTVFRAAGSVEWSGSLSAEPTEDTRGSARVYPMPVTWRLGATANLAGGLALTGSVMMADWTETGAALVDPSTAGKATSYGVGIELGNARLFGRPAPLRVGYRSRDLPFSPGGGMATETAYTGGFGLTLLESGRFVLAGVDFSIERGKRVDTVLTEEFWRGGLSLRLAGF